MSYGIRRLAAGAISVLALLAFSAPAMATRPSTSGWGEFDSAHFAVHYPPLPQTDITAADGLVYRWFPGRCLEFHPLAEFGVLNAAATRDDAEATQRIADALVARAVHPKAG